MANSRTNLSKLQVKKTTDFSGLHEMNHLAKAFALKPDVIGSVMAYSFGVQDKSVLEFLTGGLNNKVTLTPGQMEYEWDLHMQSDRAIECIADSPQATSATPGIGRSTVEIYLAERWFDSTDLLLADDTRSKLLVVGEPYQSGNAWVYTCEINGSDMTKWIDPELIKKGAKFTKEYSVVGEYSDKGGGSGYSTPIKLRNQITTIRKTYKVTGHAAQAVMTIEIPTIDGKKSSKMWAKLAEWNEMAKWYTEMDKLYMYGEYNKTSDGQILQTDTNGYPITQGAGLRDQIAPANKRYYTKLTYALLYDFLLELSFNANQYGGNANFIGLTGLMGMKQVDDMAKTEASANNFTVTNSGTFITGSGSSLTLDGHYSTIKFISELSVTFKRFPLYDDKVRNREVHPVSGHPLESYRITFLDFGTDKDGNTNIDKVVAGNGRDMLYWHTAGSTSPYSGVAKSISEMRSSGKDGYDVHFMAECGIRLRNPLSCGELIYRVIK